MDSGQTPDLYAPNALLAAAPFSLVVVVGTVTNIPIEMTGNYSALGQPGFSPSGRQPQERSRFGGGGRSPVRIVRAGSCCLARLLSPLVLLAWPAPGLRLVVSGSS